MAAAARREWDNNRDWLRFTTRIPGDTIVTDSVKALLTSGFSPETPDKFGRTAMHTAAILGQLELARFLIARGASVDARDREGRTPLMLSASAGGLNHFLGYAPTSPWEFFWSAPLCRFEVSEADDRRLDPLRNWGNMVTVQEPMLRLLITAGADPAVRDTDGRDAFDYAALAGPTGFSRLLIGKVRAEGPPQCNLSVTQSPEVRGLRLGMTSREVLARFRPPSMPEADSCGRLALQLDWTESLLETPSPLPRELADVRRIGIGFLDGRLAYVRVTYDRDAAPLRPSEFRSALSKTFDLGASWRRAGDEALMDEPYSISCDGFTVMSGYYLGPYIELIDQAALRTLLRRDSDAGLRKMHEGEAERERRKRVFKP